MPVIEHTPQRMVLKSGPTTLTLSQETIKATLQRKLLFWKLTPAEAPLYDITDVTVDAGVDHRIPGACLSERAGRSIGPALPGADRLRLERQLALGRPFDAVGEADLLLLAGPVVPNPGHDAALVVDLFLGRRRRLAHLLNLDRRVLGEGQAVDDRDADRVGVKVPHRRLELAQVGLGPHPAGR
jgi:hypothetical protein